MTESDLESQRTADCADRRQAHGPLRSHGTQQPTRGGGEAHRPRAAHRARCRRKQTRGFASCGMRLPRRLLIVTREISIEGAIPRRSTLARAIRALGIVASAPSLGITHGHDDTYACRTPRRDRGGLARVGRISDREPPIEPSSSEIARCRHPGEAALRRPRVHSCWPRPSALAMRLATWTFSPCCPARQRTDAKPDSNRRYRSSHDPRYASGARRSSNTSTSSRSRKK